jgi:hypothetical protein
MSLTISATSFRSMRTPSALSRAIVSRIARERSFLICFEFVPMVGSVVVAWSADGTLTFLEPSTLLKRKTLGFKAFAALCAQKIVSFTEQSKPAIRAESSR